MYHRREFRLQEAAARVESASRDRAIRAGMGLIWCRVLAIRSRARVSLDLARRENRHFLCNSLLGVALLTILLTFEQKLVKYHIKILLLKTLKFYLASFYKLI